MIIKGTKVVLIGATCTGKSSFLKILTHGANFVARSPLDPRWDAAFPTTMGVDIIPINIIRHARPLRLNIWDCGGNLNFQTMRDDCYRDAKAAIVFKRTGSDEHLVFEEALPDSVERILYIIDYSFEDKHELYENELFNLVDGL